MAFVGEVCPLKSPLEERDGKSVMRNTADELVTNLAEVHGVGEKTLVHLLLYVNENHYTYFL